MGATFDLLLSGVDIRTLKLHASEDTKVRAIYTLIFLHKTQSTVAEYFCVSQSTIHRWLHEIFPERRNSSPAAALFPDPNSSAKPSRKLSTDDEVTFILQLITAQPLLFLREIKKLCRTNFGKTVSVATIHRTLIENNFTKNVYNSPKEPKYN
ncbi:hypothetical protein P9112_009980 [Eukaryota sp. TZLM1-RC]